MSESAAISTVVTSLKTVRDQYQQQLQNIPQYATFLRVQQLTEISPAALGIAAGTEGFSSAHDVVAALAFARDKFKEHLTSVPEYRALLAINKLIADLAEVQPETTASVEAAPATKATAAPLEEPAQETALLTGVLGHHDNYDSAVDAALSDVPSLSDLQATAEPIAAADAAAVVAETHTFETHAFETPAPETHPVETNVADHVTETTVIETTVGEVAFEPYPNVMPTAEDTAGEAATENTGAERAA